MGEKKQGFRLTIGRLSETEGLDDNNSDGVYSHEYQTQLRLCV